MHRAVRHITALLVACNVIGWFSSSPAHAHLKTQDLSCHGPTNDVVRAVVSVRQVKKADSYNRLGSLSYCSQSTLDAAQISDCVWPVVQLLYKLCSTPLPGPGLARVPVLTMRHQAEPSHFEHFVTCHMPIASSEVVIYSLITKSQDIFVYAQHFLHPS